MLSPGDRFAHQFTVPGHYHYCCLPHEDFETMAGKVVVRTSAGEIPPPPKVVEPDTDHVIQMGLMGYYPGSLTVQPGDSVGWVNGTGIAHSVTGEDGRQVIPEGDDRVFPENGEYFASGGSLRQRLRLRTGEQRERAIYFQKSHSFIRLRNRVRIRICASYILLIW
ncbi:cupredoxin domain-containing protein (plasmid) [Haloarcula sp. NS06]|uniref:cupredoxin domain-containing protein n=1 Tax=Haloarcula sp. NS06 TaxID=3409688 RepID=UPI003DA6E912